MMTISALTETQKEQFPANFYDDFSTPKYINSTIWDYAVDGTGEIFVYNDMVRLTSNVQPDVAVLYTTDSLADEYLVQGYFKIFKGSEMGLSISSSVECMNQSSYILAKKCKKTYINLAGGDGTIRMSYVDPDGIQRWWRENIDRWTGDGDIARIDYGGNRWVFFRIKRTAEDYEYWVIDPETEAELMYATIPRNQVKYGALPDYIWIGDPMNNDWTLEGAVDSIEYISLSETTTTTTTTTSTSTTTSTTTSVTATSTTTTTSTSTTTTTPGQNLNLVLYNDRMELNGVVIYGEIVLEDRR